MVDASFTAGWRDYWVYYVTLLQDLPIRLGWPGASFDVAWSLGVEERFYLIWPVVGFVLLRQQTRLVPTATLIAALSALVVWKNGSAAATILVSFVPILIGCAGAMLLHSRYWFDIVRRSLSAPLFIVLVTLLLLPQHEIVQGSTVLELAYFVLAGLWWLVLR